MVAGVTSKILDASAGVRRLFMPLRVRVIALPMERRKPPAIRRGLVTQWCRWHQCESTTSQAFSHRAGGGVSEASDNRFLRQLQNVSNVLSYIALGGG